MFQILNNILHINKMTDTRGLDVLKNDIITKIEENNYTITDITHIISGLLKIITNKQDNEAEGEAAAAVTTEAAAAAVATEAAVAGEAAAEKLGGKRKPSKYNIFMKKELERLKKKDPSSDHKQRFKDAVKNWNNKKQKF